MNFNCLEKHRFAADSIAYRLFFIVICIYLLLFGYNTLTRTKNFADPDTMNFVDVARNITNGRGITQSALGFNQAHFSADDQIPSPLTAQPPLYPLTIAFFSKFDLSHADAGILVSLISYGLIVFLSFRLALELYDVRVALLVVCMLMLYGPLRLISTTAFSDGLSIVFLLASFLILIQMCRSKTYHLTIPAAAGLLTGLAFATRYAMLPLLGLGIVFIFLESNRKLRDICLFVVGFIIVGGLVLGHNLYVSCSLMPHRNTSTIGLLTNILQAVKVITTEYFFNFSIRIMLKPEKQMVLFIILLVILTIFIAVKKKILDAAQDVFVKNGRYLLTLWVLGYLGYLVFVRTIVHLDEIDMRLVAPAGVILLLILAAYGVKATEIKHRYIICFGFVILAYLISHEAYIAKNRSAYSHEQMIFRSERLSWVAKNTTDRDLIIGDGTVDIAFYFAYPSVISFSPYPESDVPDYKKIKAFCNKHCHKYDNIYLIVRPADHLISHAPDMQKMDFAKDEEKLEHAYGRFISDIIYGRLKNYPDVIFLKQLNEGYIYKVLCRS